MAGIYFYTTDNLLINHDPSKEKTENEWKMIKNSQPLFANCNAVWTKTSRSTTARECKLRFMHI